MGMVGTVLGTLGMAFLQGRAQQQQLEAQARQADANAAIQQQNADIMAQNSKKARENAEEMARANAQDVERERRKRLLYLGKQTARGGASGLTNSGSLANALADTQREIDYETEMNLYNGQQNVYKQFGQATDMTNQSAQYKYTADVYRKNASDYRAAKNQVMITSMLGAGLGLASGFIGGGSGGMSGTNSWSGSGWSNVTSPSVGTWSKVSKLYPGR